jgi:hypothetical protein
MPARTMVLAVAVSSAISAVIAFALGLVVAALVVTPGPTRAQAAAAPPAAGPQALLGAQDASPAVVPVLRTERVDLVDANGTVRARLGIDGSGVNESVGLTLLDPTGQDRASMGVTAVGTGVLQIGSKAPQPGARTTIVSSGPVSALAMWDERGAERVQIEVEPAGPPLLRLMNERNQPIWEAQPGSGR